MKPAVGQLWLNNQYNKYVLVRMIYDNSMTIDFEYLKNNENTWCYLSEFVRDYTFVSG